MALTIPSLKIGLSGGSSLAAQIAALFANGEQGAWYDPSDFSTMFQDSAGTTPVTAVGQPVGRILDKSGRGNHALQVTAAARPVLRQDGTGRYYLDFDGVDDSLATASIDFTATNKMTVCAGAFITTSALGMITELSNTSANLGCFYLAANIAANADGFNSKGGTASLAQAAALAAPRLRVLTGLGDISGDSSILRINGAQAAANVSDQGAGNFGNWPLYVGARAGTSLFYTGRVYGMIVRGVASNPAQIASIETYMNSKTGAY